jgi:branched-chain amino acid transport system permease protein
MTARLTRPRTLALLALAAFLVAYPFFASSFWVVAIGIKSLWLGVIAVSLIFLAGTVGLVSLAQTAIYGTAGYVVANLTVMQGWGGWPAAAVAVVAAVAVAVLIALISSRTSGIYFLMITFAIAVFLYFFALQYRPFTNGFSGINGVQAPDLFGLSLRDATSFYFLALAVAVLAYLAVRHVIRSPFGLTLQGIRDSAQRMAALGYDVTLHRVAAFAFAGLVAAFGGVLAVWYNGQISPGSVDVTRTIDVLVVAVIGGLYRLEGAWIGALAVTLLTNFANDYTPRFNTVIGLIFIAILVLSPGGISGIWESVARGTGRVPRTRGTQPPAPQGAGG